MKRFTQAISVLLILSGLSFSLLSCDFENWKIEDEKTNKGEQFLLTYIQFYSTCESPPVPEVLSTTVTDREDGTIRVTDRVRYSYGRDDCDQLFGYTNSEHYYIKKCAQGQIYRQEQNDCQGKGTAANFWGAEKFDHCYETETTCYSEGLESASLSCGNESFKGLSWNPLDVDKIKSVNEDVYPLLVDVPHGEGNLYWGSFDIKYYIKDDSSGIVADYSYDYSSVGFTICGARE